jgi:hypothetical protein
MELALASLWARRMTTFRIVFLVGFIHFISGMIVWSILGLSVGVVLMALWFGTAFYFARAERSERAKARSPRSSSG